MSRPALLFCLLALPVPARALSASPYYSHLSELVRSEQQTRLARAAPLPAALSLRLAVASVASASAPVGGLLGASRRIRDIPRLSGGRDWLEDLHKAPQDILLELTRPDPGRPHYYTARGRAGAQAVSGFAQVVFHGEPSGLMELILGWRVPTGTFRTRTYFQFDGRGGIVPVRFRSGGFRDPVADGSVDLEGELTFFGGFSVPLAGARLEAR